MVRYLHSMTEDYSQVVDHTSVPDRFSYLPIIDSSCNFGLKPVFRDKNQMWGKLYASLWWQQKTKNLTLFNLPSGTFTFEDVSPSTVYFSWIFNFPKIFCILETFPILLFSILQGGLFVREGKSTVRQTHAAHGDVDGACSYSQRRRPVMVIQKIPSACWLLFLTVYIF